MRWLKASMYLLLLITPVGVTLAQEQLSRQQYIAMSHDDLLAPCRDAKFVVCLGSTQAACLKQVNQLVEACGKQLPAVIDPQNFDTSAGSYANCVFEGLQQGFGKTSEEIGQCETRAGLK